MGLTDADHRELYDEGMSQTNDWPSSDVDDGKLDDEEISEFMDWVLPSSANTLDYINMEGVNMTNIPLQFADFDNFNNLKLTQPSTYGQCE